MPRVPADRDGWLALVRESMVETWALLAEATADGRTIRRPGVMAAVVPATPDRSVSNSVIYDDREAMLAALDELGAAYADAGVRAWTVWVPEDDAAAARGLAEAGHTLDAEPRAMGIELADVERPDLTGIAWTRDCDFGVVGRVNDDAYGYDHAAGLGVVIAAVPRERAYSYGALVDGEVAAVLMTFDFGDDTEVAWVATSGAARGRGLATALMRQALWDARERGRLTSTLQATKLGAPVYRRVGYRDLGALQMWERR